jgi:hypothetical protein
MGVVSSLKYSVPEAALARCLRELPHYVVLRNEEDLFENLQRGGDIDLLVADLRVAERTLIRHLGTPIRIIRSSYVSGYSYDWGHVDLLPTVEWRGACYLPTEAILEGRRLSPRGRSVPRIAHEALISWLSSLLWGGFFKARYATKIREALEIDASAFQQTLIEVAGKKLGLRLWQAAVDGHAEISAEWTRSLRQAVWWRACFRSPVRTIQRSAGFLIGELRLRLQPPVPWLAIVDTDGSRESSLTNEIVHRFAACPYGNVTAVHWRSRLMARARGDEPVTDRQERSSRGRIGAGWRLVVLAADWLVCYWARWARLRAKGYILALDRTYFDVIVDHARDRGGAGALARVAGWLLPKPDLVFILDSERVEILDSERVEPWPRMKEVSSSEVARRRQAGRVLARQLPAGQVVDGSLPLHAVVDEIQHVIRAWMLNRSVMSLGDQAPIVTAPTANAVGASGAPTSVSRGDGAQ